jgi:hypothetical protein
MGTWGPGIFSDDTACDVRERFRELVGDGLAAPDATDTLLAEYADTLTDADEGPVVWLALASTQWKCGRLQDRVRVEALEIIRCGAGLERWREQPKLLRRRQLALDRLRDQLVAAQPPPMRIPKRFRSSCDWETGEIVGYRLKSGSLALFRVIGFHSDHGGVSPVVELLDWNRAKLPSRFSVLMARVRADGRGRTQFLLGWLSEKEFPTPRIVRTGLKSRPSQRPGAFTCFFWRQLDKDLEEAFGLK